MWMSVCPSVRPSVRVSVRVCVCHRFSRFLRRAYGPVTPSDPLRKTSTLVSPDPFENLSTYISLKSKISDHFFDKKRVFTKKVPSFTRCKNFCTKSIDNHQKYTFAWCLQRVTRSIILVNLKLLILKSKHLLVLFTKLRATRPAGCCLVMKKLLHFD